MAHPLQVVPTPTFKNILYTTDFSLCSEAALPYARAIAEEYGATVHMVHVVGAESTHGELGVRSWNLESDSQAAREQLDKLAQSDALRNIRLTQSVQTGSVGDVVTRLVADLHIDLVVLGTHGRRGLKHFLLGSIAEQIFRRAACPVLTVGPEVRRQGLAQGHLAMILYATDFSSASLHALCYALSLATGSRARLTLLHALETERIVTRLEEGVVNAIHRLNELMEQSSGVSCDPMIMSGSAAESVLRAARSAEADLIVMGAHAGALASAHTPCAVAHRVVCHASCPVLTVRA